MGEVYGQIASQFMVHELVEFFSSSHYLFFFFRLFREGLRLAGINGLDWIGWMRGVGSSNRRKQASLMVLMR